MENVNKTNSVSNETTAADNKSAIEVWRNFKQQLKRFTYKDDKRYEYPYYFIFMLEDAVKDYIRFCFQSVSHKRLSKDACDVYFTSIFNAATETFIFSGTDIAAKIRNADIKNITEVEYVKIRVAMINAIEEKMCIPKGTLGKMIINKMESRIYINESANSSKYDNLNIFKEYCRKELAHMMGAGCTANLIEDIEKYLRLKAFKDNEVVHYYYDYNAEANIIVNGMLEEFFKDEGYHTSATIIMLVASGQKSINDISNADLHNITSDLYEAMETYINVEPGTLMYIV